MELRKPMFVTYSSSATTLAIIHRLLNRPQISDFPKTA